MAPFAPPRNVVQLSQALGKSLFLIEKWKWKGVYPRMGTGEGEQREEEDTSTRAA